MKALDVSNVSGDNVPALSALLADLIGPVLAAKHSAPPSHHVANDDVYPAMPRDELQWRAFVDYVNALEVLAAKAGHGALPPRPPGL